jgi:hypothetical protein
MSEDQIVYENVEGPESYRTIVKGPMLRVVSADAVVKILSEKTTLNAPKKHETFFYTYNPSVDEPHQVGYGEGSSQLGFFVVFPEEANKKPLERKEPKFTALNPSILQEISIKNDDALPNSEINSNEYLFIRPEEWSDIKACTNIAEAEAILEERHGKREDREQKIIQEAREFIEAKKKVEDIIRNMSHPVFTDSDAWIGFYLDCIANPKQVKDHPEWVRESALNDLNMLHRIKKATESPDVKDSESLWDQSFVFRITKGADPDKIARMSIFLK